MSKLWRNKGVYLINCDKSLKLSSKNINVKTHPNILTFIFSFWLYAQFNIAIKK